MCVLFLCLQLEVVEDDKVLRSLLSDDPADVVYASGPITQVTMNDIPLLLKIICVHSCVVPLQYPEKVSSTNKTTVCFRWEYQHP